MKTFCYLLIFIIGCTAEKDKYALTYTPFSKSVVHVNFRSDPVDSLSISAIAFTNIPKDMSESNALTISKAGDYYLNLDIDRPVKSFLNLGEKQYNVFIIPTDTTHINVNFAHDEVVLNFSGKTKVMNEYYHEKKRILGYTDIRLPLNKSLSSKTTYNILKLSTDSVINQELSFLEKYPSRNRLPEWFLDYERSELIYMGAGYKTQMPHANEIMKYFKDAIPNDYYDFLSHIKIDNSKAILSTHYFWFLDDYFVINLPPGETNHLTGFSRTNKFMSHKLNESKQSLSGKIKELYYKYNFSSIVKFYADSLAIDSVAKEFQLTDYKELVKLSGSRSRSEIQMLNLNKGDTIPEFILADVRDSIISIREFHDKIFYINFWATWCGPCIYNIPVLNNLIAQYDAHPKITFLNICLDSEKKKWIASIEKHKLKGINLIAEGNWNSKLRAYFNIKGIPHYVIVNKGNILFENATDKAPKVQGKIEAILTE